MHAATEYRRSVVTGARRRRLIAELSGARAPIRLCAPAGYGKSVFARLLSDGGVTAPVREERRLRPRSSGGIVVGADPLAFDEEEIARVFAPVEIAADHLAHIAELTAGWPIAVLYFLRLSRLGIIERAIGDQTDPAFDDLFEYVEHNIYKPATRTQRLALLAGETGFYGNPLVRAAMRAHHAEELHELHLHRARSAAGKSSHATAAAWFLAAGCADEAAEALAQSTDDGLDCNIIASLPFTAVQHYPQLWLRVCELRLERLGAPAFATEAAAIAKALEREPDTYTRSSLWLAIAHAFNGNLPAALAARDRAIEIAGDAAADSEVYRLLEMLNKRLTARAMNASKAKPRSRLRIELFRGSVILDDREIGLAQREAAVLLTLAAAPERRVDPDRLAAMIWPETDAGQVHAALKVTITRLRARLQSPDFVRFTNGQYALHGDVHVDLTDVRRALDAHEREDAPSALHAFEALIGAYRPPRLRDAAWFAPIEFALVDCAHRLAQHLTQNADALAVRRIGEALLAADPCDEQGCALLVRSHLMEDRPDAARDEYNRFAERLRRELDCDPSLPFDALAGEFHA